MVPHCRTTQYGDLLGCARVWQVGFQQTGQQAQELNNTKVAITAENTPRTVDNAVSIMMEELAKTLALEKQIYEHVEETKKIENTCKNEIKIQKMKLIRSQWKQKRK